jgi:dynactin complex subunit
MKDQKKRGRFLPCRISDDEYNLMYERFKKTECSSFSDFIRRVLLQDEIITSYRNQSLDDLMTELMALRMELKALGNNFNQVAKKLNSVQSSPEIILYAELANAQKEELLKKINDIQSRIDKFSDLWLQ